MTIKLTRHGKFPNLLAQMLYYVAEDFTPTYDRQHESIPSVEWLANLLEDKRKYSSKGGKCKRDNIRIITNLLSAESSDAAVARIHLMFGINNGGRCYATIELFENSPAQQAGEIIQPSDTVIPTSTITAAQYDAGASLEGVTAIDFGPITITNTIAFFAHADNRPAKLYSEPLQTMFLSEILTRYTNQTLADENDVCLANAQQTISELHRTMVRCGESQFTFSNSPEPITTQYLTTVGQFIYRTLNARYGCND